MHVSSLSDTIRWTPKRTEENMSSIPVDWGQPSDPVWKGARFRVFFFKSKILTKCDNRYYKSRRLLFLVRFKITIPDMSYGLSYIMNEILWLKSEYIWGIYLHFCEILSKVYAFRCPHRMLMDRCRDKSTVFQLALLFLVFCSN